MTIDFFDTKIKIVQLARSLGSISILAESTESIEINFKNFPRYKFTFDEFKGTIGLTVHVGMTRLFNLHANKKDFSERTIGQLFTAGFNVCKRDLQSLYDTYIELTHILEKMENGNNT